MKKVMIFGTFDGVHAGHRHVFREARRIGEELDIVEQKKNGVAKPRGRARLYAVVARDSTVKRVKGVAPKYPECVRWAYLHGEKDIDVAVLGSLGSKHDVIKKYKPDVICLGYDQERFLRGLEKVFRGKVVRLKPYKSDRYKSSKLPRRQEYTQEAKKRFRAFMLARRDSILVRSRARASKVIEKKIFENADIKKAQSVFLYRSIGSEVKMDGLFRSFLKSGKDLYVPVLERVGQFSACRVDKKTKWRENRFGILEPEEKKKYTGSIDVCIVPNVAVTEKGDRLGMGGGYYDRYLAKGQCRKSIAVAYGEQIVPCVPVERWDRRVDEIIFA